MGANQEGRGDAPNNPGGEPQTTKKVGGGGGAKNDGRETPNQQGKGRPPNQEGAREGWGRGPFNKEGPTKKEWGRGETNNEEKEKQGKEGKETKKRGKKKKKEETNMFSSVFFSFFLFFSFLFSLFFFVKGSKCDFFSGPNSVTISQHFCCETTCFWAVSGRAPLGPLSFFFLLFFVFFLFFQKIERKRCETNFNKFKKFFHFDRFFFVKKMFCFCLFPPPFFFSFLVCNSLCPSQCVCLWKTSSCLHFSIVAGMLSTHRAWKDICRGTISALVMTTHISSQILPSIGLDLSAIANTKNHNLQI